MFAGFGSDLGLRLRCHGIPWTNSVKRKGDGRLVDHVGGRWEIGEEDKDGFEDWRYTLETVVCSKYMYLLRYLLDLTVLRSSHSSHPRRVPRSGAHAGT